MPRPNKNGEPARLPRKRKLTELLVRKLKPEPAAFNIWDARQSGLVLRVQPSGHRAWKAVFRHHGRPRWYHIGDADAIGLADARRFAARVMLQAAEGKDPAAERRAERGRGTFEELADRYREHAKRKNKSWRQADALTRRYLLPRWAKLQAAAITRADVKTTMARIAAPVLANQVLAAASAIFSWAIHEEVLTDNPCKLVDRNPTQSRERVLSESEIPKFWSAFDSAGLVRGAALKTILLTGQRPGEVASMRREHVVDGWWELPGAPALGWPGTKNGQSHRVWLPELAREIIAELTDDGVTTGFVFAGPRGHAVSGLDAAMRTICSELGVEKATPHDLRRTHGTKITALGFGRDKMNRIQNHREGGIGDVYDRHGYADEIKQVMEAVAARILALVEGGPEGNNVVQGQFYRQLLTNAPCNG